MNNFKNFIGVEKIELMFAKNINYFRSKKQDQNKLLKRKIRIEHLYWIPSFLFNRTYRIIPKILKDVLFCFSVIHKSPTTKLFARTKYDEIRTKIDIKISSLAIKGAPDRILENLKNTFSSGFHTDFLSNISDLDLLIDGVFDYAKPSHAGARPFFKDGKNTKIEGSFSAYYTFSKKDNQKINSILRKSLDKDFIYYLSVLAGYKCTIKDISHSLGIVIGENSNSEMHQDTYASVAKGFIYLQDVADGNSPFEYIEGSYLDATFRSKQTNKAVINGDFYSSGSTRLRGKELEKAIKSHKLKIFTGSKGLFVLANTGGYHRKGAHKSNKPRITLACGVKRKGLVSKLLINIFAIIKSKLFKL